MVIYISVSGKDKKSLKPQIETLEKDGWKKTGKSFRDTLFDTDGYCAKSCDRHQVMQKQYK